MRKKKLNKDEKIICLDYLAVLTILSIDSNLFREKNGGYKIITHEKIM